MAYSMGKGDPWVRFDVEAVEKKMAAMCKTRNITSDAELTTKLGAMTDAQTAAFCREFFAALFALRTNP